MCGGSYVGRGMRHGVWRHAGGREFTGREVEKMSPRARISAALSMLLPVGLSGVFLVAFVPSVWWIFTTYFWIAFPAFGLLTSGIAALGEGRAVRLSEEERERELLEAIRESGEISAAAAAARTSLTVAEPTGGSESWPRTATSRSGPGEAPSFTRCGETRGRPGGGSRNRREHRRG